MKTKWTRHTEKTDGGSALATIWTARVGRIVIQVTNWPGTRTLDLELTIPGSDWRVASSEDRYEFSVARLKAHGVARAERILRPENSR